MRIVTFILILLVSNGFAQNFHNDVRFFDDTVHQSLQFNSFGYYGSTVLDIHTSKLFYKGGHFSESLKSESFERLTDLNYFGGEYGFQMAFNNPLKKIYKDYGYYVNYEIKGAAGVSFNDDLFKVIFEGNSNYIGDSIHIGPMEMSSFQYKKIGFGLNKNDRIKLGIGLLGFDAWQSAKLSSGYLMVDENVDSVNINAEGRLRSSQPSNGPIGFGVAFDFEVTMPLQGLNDTVDYAKLVIGMKNLGLFFSNKQMITYNVDTTYSFSGFNLTSISDFQSSLANTDNLKDSLVPKGDTNRIVDLLPFELYFFAPSRPGGRKLQLVYGFRYRYGVGAMPQVYAGGDWRPNNKTVISNYLHLGGYAKVQWGLSIKKAFGDFKIGVSSNNLHGFFTKEAYSQSLGLTMSYVIK